MCFWDTFGTRDANLGLSIIFITESLGMGEQADSGEENQKRQI